MKALQRTLLRMSLGLQAALGLATAASALLGSAIGFGGWALASGLEDEDAWFQSALIGMAGAPIGALIGFNATRGLREGVPAVSLSPRHGGGWAGLLTWRLGVAP